MKQLVTGLLVSALLFGGVPWAMADGKVQLRQPDGSVTPLGGDGEAAKVTPNTLLSGEDKNNSVFRVESQWEYEDVAASQTDQVMGVIGGAGDLLHALKCETSAASVGKVTVKDGAGSSFTIFLAQGAAAMLDSPALDWVSTSGAWSVTTGTNTTCRVSGRFS